MFARHGFVESFYVRGGENSDGYVLCDCGLPLWAKVVEIFFAEIEFVIFGVVVVAWLISSVGCGVEV